MDRPSSSHAPKSQSQGGLEPPRLEVIDLSDWKHRPSDESPGANPNGLFVPLSPHSSNPHASLTPLGADEENPLRARRYSHKIENSSRFGLWTVILLLLAIIMVVLTALYSTGSAKSLMRGKIFATSSSNAILVLRILTELCAVMLSALVIVVVEDLQWALASRPEGLDLLHFIGLDSGTGVWGLCRLLATADWKQKYSSAFRLLVILSIPLPGIILMGDIKIELVFFPEESYPVAAGLADFNSSFISELTQVTTTALLVQMGNPLWSDRNAVSIEPLGPGRGHCTASNTTSEWVACEESYYMSGGVNSISPQADDLASFPEAKAYVVPNVKGYHVEYGEVHDIQTLHDEGNCHLIGSASAAAYWCAAIGSQQELLFGSAYCPISLQLNSSCLNSTDWTSTLGLATSMFVYRRFATVNYSRTNFSIVSLSNLSEAEAYPIALEDYMIALSSVVPGFNASADVRGDNSQLAIYAVTALPISDSQVAKRISLKAVRKAMSVPLDYFQANYFSDGPRVWELQQPRAGLPADMYTQLSIAVLSHQVVAGWVSRWLFVASASVLLVVAAAAIVATVRVCERRPERCGYPSLDFAAVCCATRGEDDDGAAGGGAGAGASKSGLHRSLTSLGERPDKYQVASRIRGERVVLR